MPYLLGFHAIHTILINPGYVLLTVPKILLKTASACCELWSKDAHCGSRNVITLWFSWATYSIKVWSKTKLMRPTCAVHHIELNQCNSILFEMANLNTFLNWYSCLFKLLEDVIVAFNINDKQIIFRILNYCSKKGQIHLKSYMDGPLWFKLKILILNHPKTMLTKFWPLFHHLLNPSWHFWRNFITSTIAQPPSTPILSA